MSLSRKAALTSILTTLLTLVVLALPNAVSASSAAGDFSSSSNPNGAWSYGWSSTLGSAFNLDTSNTTNHDGTTGLSGWMGNQAPDGAPDVLYNATSNTITWVATTFQPGQLGLSPGTGQYVVVRWTAPSTGQFSITSAFSGLSSLGDSVDVHILRNGISIFDSTVVGSPNPTTYSGLQNLSIGNTIDFVVGWGSNGNNHDDTTGLTASIVPEPSTLGLVGAGLGCLLSLRFLKRK
jgi:hypothetical protein